MSSFIPPVDWPTDLPPWEDIKASFEADDEIDGFYEMQMVDDYDIIKAVYKMGIDSRLEAITEPSTNEWVPNPPFGSKLKLRLDIKSLLVFLRRLWEMTYDEGALEDEESPGSRAERLVRDIIGTLGIEMI